MRNLSELLEQRSIPEPNSGCRLWLGGLSGGNYPVLRWRGKTWSVGNLILHCQGMDMTGLDACHSCDNTYCIEESHLFHGTRKDNMQDAKRKGRLVGYGVREFCKHGHPLSGDNVRTDAKSGKRWCVACKRIRERTRGHRDRRHAND